MQKYAACITSTDNDNADYNHSYEHDHNENELNAGQICSKVSLNNGDEDLTTSKPPERNASSGKPVTKI